MSVRQAQREIDSVEFAEWRAYDRIEPIGAWRADLNAATITAAVVNAGQRGRHRRIARPDQFMPRFWKPKPTARDLFERMKALNEAFGGEFVARD